MEKKSKMNLKVHMRISSEPKWSRQTTIDDRVHHGIHESWDFINFHNNFYTFYYPTRGSYTQLFQSTQKYKKIKCVPSIRFVFMMRSLRIHHFL